MKNNTLNEVNNKRTYMFEKLQVIILMMAASVTPVFADVSQIGSNIGNWGTEQLGWIAMAVIAFMALKYLIKKAWAPCGVFILIGGALFYIIRNPEQLENIGAVIFGIATQ